MSKHVLLVALLVLTACATPASKAPDVASLSSPAHPPAQASATTAQRPRERLDMTPEDEQALRGPWVRCMTRHGVGEKAGGEPSGSGREVTQDDYLEAEKACQSVYPLPPWEKDPTNPEAVDFANRVVQCLRGKGVRYVEVLNDPDSAAVGYSFGGPGNDQQSIELGLRHVRECESAASKR